MYKINDNLSFVRDHHGFRLTETYPTVNPKTKEATVGSRDTFHPSVDSIAGKILHLCADDSIVELQLEDLRNAYYECRASIAKMLEGKANG